MSNVQLGRNSKMLWKKLISALIAISGRTLVPLRFVSEAFGIDVDWNPATRTVTITN